MEEAPKLKASSRKERAKQNKEIREQGLIPAVLYGRETDNVNIKLNSNEFDKVYQIAKESTLIDLIIDNNEPVKVLIHAIDKNPVSDDIIHIDFYKVKMDEKITAEINLLFVGESPAVKGLGGTLVKNKTAIEVECYPKDLIKEMKVDISSLKTFDDVIKVKDLKFSDNFEVSLEDNINIALVMPPRTEEEMAKLDEKVDTEIKDVEVEKKGKKEKDEDAAEEESKDSNEKDTKTPEKKQDK